MTHVLSSYAVLSVLWSLAGLGVGLPLGFWLGGLYERKRHR